MWCITITSYLFSFHYEYNGAKIFLLHSNNDISGSAEAKTCKTTLSINAEGFHFSAKDSFWGGSASKNAIVDHAKWMSNYPIVVSGALLRYFGRKAFTL